MENTRCPPSMSNEPFDSDGCDVLYLKLFQCWNYSTVFHKFMKYVY